MQISAYSLLDWLTGAVLIVAAFAIYHLSNKSSSAKLFAYISFFTGIWSCLIAISVATSDLQVELFLIQLNHLLGTIIASIFLLFSFSYPHDTKLNKNILLAIGAAEIIFLYFLFFTSLIIGKPMVLPNLEYLGWTYGPLGFLFSP